MNHSRYDKNRSWRQGNLTAVLVDYENLYDLLVDHMQDDTHPDEFIIEMLEELNRYLQGRDLFQIAISNAYADFSDFGSLAKVIEEKVLAIKKSGLKRYPTTPVEFTEEQLEEIEKMLDKIEDDDDVQAVYTNIA